MSNENRMIEWSTGSSFQTAKAITEFVTAVYDRIRRERWVQVQIKVHESYHHFEINVQVNNMGFKHLVSVNEVLMSMHPDELGAVMAEKAMECLYRRRYSPEPKEIEARAGQAEGISNDE